MHKGGLAMSGNAGYVAMAHWEDGLSVITGPDLCSVLLSLAEVLVAGQDSYCIGTVSDLTGFLAAAKKAMESLEDGETLRTGEVMEELGMWLTPIKDGDARYGHVDFWTR